MARRLCVFSPDTPLGSGSRKEGAPDGPDLCRVPDPSPLSRDGGPYRCHDFTRHPFRLGSGGDEDQDVLLLRKQATQRQDPLDRLVEMMGTLVHRTRRLRAQEVHLRRATTCDSCWDTRERDEDPQRSIHRTRSSLVGSRDPPRRNRFTVAGVVVVSEV